MIYCPGKCLSLINIENIFLSVPSFPLPVSTIPNENKPLSPSRKAQAQIWSPSWVTSLCFRVIFIQPTLPLCLSLFFFWRISA